MKSSLITRCMSQQSVFFIYGYLYIPNQNSMNEQTEQQDRMHLNNHNCPVCSYAAKKGSVNRRKALQEHIRRAAAVDPLHRIWKDVYYARYFHWGGCAKPTAPCASDIIDVIKRVYGDDWGRKCEQAFSSRVIV
jgi:hypothetical protein